MFKTPEDYFEHNKNHGYTYRCVECGREFEGAQGHCDDQCGGDVKLIKCEDINERLMP